MTPSAERPARRRTTARDALLRRFRAEVRSGAYHPSVDALAARLADLMLDDGGRAAAR